MPYIAVGGVPLPCFQLVRHIPFHSPKSAEIPQPIIQIEGVYSNLGRAEQMIERYKEHTRELGERDDPANQAVLAVLRRVYYSIDSI